MIHPGAIGDVLLSVPAMRRLRIRYPQHQVVLCAKESIAEVLLGGVVIDARMSVDGIACADLFEPDAPCKGELKEWLSRCDCAIAWMQDPDGNVTKSLRTAGAKEAIVRSPFSSGIKATHQSDRFCEIVDGVGAPRAEFDPMPISDDLRARGLACLDNFGIGIVRPLVMVHPGSGSPQKSVAVREMAEMIARLHGEGISPVVIEGPADKKYVDDLSESLSFPVPVLRGVSLATLAGALTYANLFVGHDSGVTHLAALLGVRTVAIFGPTDSSRWAPLGSHVTVMEGPPPSVSLIASLRLTTINA